MGVYVMKISARADIVGGVLFHRASFAYKPVGMGYSYRRDGKNQNDVWEQRTCGPAIRAWANVPAERNRNILVCYGESLYMFRHGVHGTVYDSAFGRPEIGRIVRIGRRRVIGFRHPSTDPDREFRELRQ